MSKIICLGEHFGDQTEFDMQQRLERLGNALGALIAAVLEAGDRYEICFAAVDALVAATVLAKLVPDLAPRTAI